MWLVSGAVAVAAVAVYLFAYPFHDIQPAGFDIHAYEWQAKAVGHGPLSLVGARPGLPVMAALLGSVVHVDVAGQIVVLMPMLGLVLALAVAAAVRVAFRLSTWVLPVVVAVMVLYPGTARVVHGYQASLLFMVIATAGVAVLILAAGTTGRLLAAGAMFAAACLAHVVLFAIFAAIAGLYVLLSVPAFLRDRRGGAPLLVQEGDPRALNVVDGLGQPGLRQRRIHLDPGRRTADVVPDQAAAGHQLPVGVTRVAQHVSQVMCAVEEDEVQGPQPGEVVAQRVGRDEEDLVGLAEVARVTTEGSTRRVLRRLRPVGGV